PTPANWHVVDTGVDTYIYQWFPNFNFRSEPALLLRTPNLAFGLLKFDLSALPAAALVQNAQLRVYVLDDMFPAGVRLEAYLLQRDWDVSVANWNKAGDGQPWSVPGALGPEDRSDAPIAISLDVQPAGFVTLDLTGIVQQWLDDPLSNHGILLAFTSTADTDLQVASFENPVQNWRPRLEILLAGG
ncbi:MAG: DNRLRE domain-containing protein, partial [Chloroflexi bacterium]